MPKEVQETRRSYIDRRADELALSGAFANWHGVKTALCDAGYLEVDDVLFSRRKRAFDKRTLRARDWSAEFSGTA